MLRLPRVQYGEESVLRYLQSFGKSSFGKTSCARLTLCCVGAVLMAWTLPAAAQTCTPQSMMTADLRDALTNSGLALASAIKAGDTARVEALAAPDLTANFEPTAYLVRSTSAKIAADTLMVTHRYELDASGRKAGDASEADFGCALPGSTDEVDFAIPALPPGVYGFVMVEATGPRPWLLALLLEQQNGGWKMAGFYPHARSVAGHDGLWYWTTARADAKAGKKWLAWVLYGEADQLLRPANFVSSTHLDKLRTERSDNAPGELSDGISATTPLVIIGKGGEFHFTDLSSAGTDDDNGLDLVLRYRVDSIGEAAAATARNVAAAKAMLEAHPELREGFTGFSVFAEAAGQPAFATELSPADVR